MFLHIFRHIEPDHIRLIVKQKLGQRPGQFGFSHPGRPQKDERPNRPVRVFEPRAGPNHRVGHRLDGLFLTDQPLVQQRAEVQEFFSLAFEQLCHGNARPA